MLHLIAAEAPNGVHLAGDINEVIWGSIAFFVVVGLLAKLAGPFIVKGFKGRTERIEAELAAAKAERADAEAALTAKSVDLPDLATEEARILRDAEETAVQLKADLLSKAQAEADEVRARGTLEVQNYRRQALADITAEVSRLTKDSAEAVVVGNLDDRSQSDLIESYIAEVEQLS